MFISPRWQLCFYLHENSDSDYRVDTDAKFQSGRGHFPVMDLFAETPRLCSLSDELGSVLSLGSPGSAEVESPVSL